MFICQVTKRVSAPGERAIRVVVQTRETIYPAQSFQHGKHKITDLGGAGTQIAKELVVSAAGYHLMQDFPDTWREEAKKEMVVDDYVHRFTPKRKEFQGAAE